MMKLAILGATGRTGVHLVEQALEEGHEVVAIVRTPSKVTTEHENLKVVSGDITSTASLKEHLRDVTLWYPVWGAGNLEKRHLVLGVDQDHCSRDERDFHQETPDPNDRGPFLIEWILRPLVLKNVLENMAVMETYLKEEAQDLDFTTVRPPGLKDGPKTDLEIAHEERNFVGGTATTMLRADVARFLLQCLKTDEFNKKWIAIGVKP
ncbi:putative flavin reductase (NADPH)-like [Apostichopus japonicus]|uniref:Putative flavin reductase (NADPH)-like n=1 Tax=Stichopus japonicus TaxID=307972 RepID=A0A2G8KVT7_STIJA|nr:putative flavin reductase (NADPH)-like [Apostichopus japonicus]